MKLTVLTDNNSIIDNYYLAEPGLSFMIEDDDKTILFDTGYSDVFKRNAIALHKDLGKIDTLVFSHGHNDHTGGVKYIFDLPQEIEVICHSDCEKNKSHYGLDVGMPIKLKEFPENFTVKKTNREKWISKNILYLGQIARTVQPGRKLEDDFLYDDTALAYVGADGLFIITGCSHSGICNIIEQAKRLTGIIKVAGVIGGFHLLNDAIQTKEVCDYFDGNGISNVYPCHCTDLKAKIELSRVCDVKEVGVGQVIEL